MRSCCLCPLSHSYRGDRFIPFASDRKWLVTGLVWTHRFFTVCSESPGGVRLQLVWWSAMLEKLVAAKLHTILAQVQVQVVSNDKSVVLMWVLTTVSAEENMMTEISSGITLHTVRLQTDYTLGLWCDGLLGWDFKVELKKTVKKCQHTDTWIRFWSYEQDQSWSFSLSM